MLMLVLLLRNLIIYLFFEKNGERRRSGTKIIIIIIENVSQAGVGDFKRRLEDYLKYDNNCDDVHRHRTVHED